MSSAVYDTTTADITAGKYEFRATGSIMKFQGFIILYEEAQEVDRNKENGDKEKGEHRLPQLEEGLTLKLLDLDPKQHFTQPPPRYTEASLIKELEEKGIGRPSTYTSILTVIRNRDYVEVEERKFKPTPLGMLVTEKLVENFPTILDVEFTARMEEELDRIENGQRRWGDTISDFYEGFLKYLQKAETDMKSVKGEETGVICVKCGSPMVVRLSKSGPFLACSAYPKCKNTSPMPGTEGEESSAAVQEVSDETCEKCGSPMVVKEGRYGKFLACSAYPECKNTRNIGAEESQGPKQEESTDQTCEKCGSPMVVKEGRYGKFLACSAYPECKNTRNIGAEESQGPKQEESTDQTCEKCGSPMVVKEGRYGKFLACSAYPECKNTKPVETGIKCPQEGCDGQVVPRRTKKGRTFYGCSKYPECRFAVWDKPVDTECPDCGHPYLLEKYSRTEGKRLQCPDKNCGYTEALEEEAEESTA